MFHSCYEDILIFWYLSDLLYTFFSKKHWLLLLHMLNDIHIQCIYVEINMGYVENGCLIAFTCMQYFKGAIYLFTH